MQYNHAHSTPACCESKGRELVHVDQFSHKDYCKEDALALWREIANDINDVMVTEDEASRLAVETSAAQIDHLALSTFKATSHRFRRDARHLKKGFSEYIRVRIYNSGQSRGLYGETPMVLGPGAVHVIDYSRPSYEIIDDIDQVGMYIPHWAIGYDPSRHSQHIAFSLQSATGRILADAVNSLHCQTRHMHESETATIALGFGGLLGAFLNGVRNDAQDHSFQVARGASMHSYIDKHLRDTSLGIKQLGKVFGAARATIYRDFEKDGGVDRYIVRRRLERAYLDLANHPNRRGVVQNVADSWGFSSVSYFSRVFKDTFGLPPGEVAGMQTVPAIAGLGEPCGVATCQGKAGRQTGIENFHVLGSWLSAFTGAYTVN